MRPVFTSSVQKSFGNCRVDQHGAVMVLFVSSVFCLVVMVGLAIDSGNLYTRRIAAQTSADAGAIAGAGMLSMNLDTGQARSVAEEIARRNLTIVKAVPASIVSSLVAVYDPGASSITVTIAMDVPLYLLSILGSGTTRRVSVISQARVNPAHVSMILDTSLSMACPQVGPCTCSPNCAQGPGSKIEALRQAAQQFINFFNSSNDSIALTAFSTVGEVLEPMRARGFNSSSMSASISTLDARGSTNVSDALVEAFLDARRLGVQNKVSYVYYADGPATAGRFFFQDIASAVKSDRSANVIGEPWAQYDFTIWGVRQLNDIAKYPSPFTEIEAPCFTDPADATKVDCPFPGDFYFTPRTQADRRKFRMTTNPSVHGERTWGFPIEGDDPTKDRDFKMRNWLQQPFNYLALGNITTLMPDRTTRQLAMGAPAGTAAQPGIWNGSSLDWSRWHRDTHLQLFVDQGLHWSDYLRDQGGKFYTIGYGDPAFISPDAYQNIGDTNSRKDFTLGRMSTDLCSISQGDPRFPGFASVAELIAAGNAPGSYYPTSDLANLERIFRSIAVRIRLRLVQ